MTLPEVGPPVDTTPAKPPGDVKLEGRFGAVEKLDPLQHGTDLWNAVNVYGNVPSKFPPPRESTITD